MSDRYTRTPEQRFWQKVNETDGCWTWTAFINPDGYGMFKLGARTLLAHRLAYTWLAGPIPEGLQLDHLCRNRACVNPGHLEPVTGGENTRRSPIHDEWQRSKVHCPQGHPYSGDNLYVHGNRRRCRICSKAARERYRVRQLADERAD